MRARQVYLDNAAATWPNPPEVVSAMAHFLNQVGANPGRSGHQASVEAARVVYRAREAVAGLLGLADPLRVVFTANATHALNLALYGMLGPADHCITTSMEHNSVMRPLRDLEANGMGLTVVPCSPEGVLDPADDRAGDRPRDGHDRHQPRLQRGGHAPPGRRSRRHRPRARDSRCWSTPRSPPERSRSTWRSSASTCWPSPATRRSSVRPAPAAC